MTKILQAVLAQKKREKLNNQIKKRQNSIPWKDWQQKFVREASCNQERFAHNLEPSTEYLKFSEACTFMSTQVPR